MGKDNPLLEKIIELRIQLRDLYFEHHQQRELFTWVWWLSIALIIVPLVVWWKTVDKKRLLEICVFGLLVNICATFLDVVGTDYALWEYPVRPLPKLALLLPVDYVIVPVVGMAIYQRCAKWWKFLLACTIASAVMSFLCEPFAAYIDMYKLITWRYVYSFPIYIAIYVVIRLITEKLKRVKQSHG